MLAYVAISTEKVPPKIQGLAPSKHRRLPIDGKRRSLSNSTKMGYNGYSLIRPLFNDVATRKVTLTMLLNRARKVKRKRTVLETDAGGMVENTKAYERTTLKELGKMTL
jgi:hypothetical protein